MDPAGSGARQRLPRQQGLEIKVDAQLAKPASPLGRDAGDRTARLGVTHPADRRSRPLEDSGFLGGDRTQGAAQLPDVVEGDAGDDREHGVNHVRRVESPPHADLEHDGPNLPAGKMQEPHGRRDLEEGWSPMVKQVRIVQLELLDDDADLVHQLGQLARRGRSAVDAEALLQAVQMRRTVQSGTKPGGRERGRHHRGRRAFAFGPRNVNHSQSEVRITQAPQEPSHSTQPQLGRNPGHSHPFVIQAAVQKVEAILVFVEHGSWVSSLSAGAGDLRWRRGSPTRFDDDRGPGQAQSFTADSVAGEGDPSTDSIRALNSASERSFVQ